MSHTHTHTYTPTLTHTHSHKPTRTHTHTHTHRHIHYIPNYSPDPAHKCLYARPSLFRSLHEYIWPLFRALLPVQETSDLYPVLLVLVQHDAEEAQDHRGRRQGRQPLNIYIYTVPTISFQNFPEISMKSAGKGTIAIWRNDFQYMDVAGAQNKAWVIHKKPW